MADTNPNFTPSCLFLMQEIYLIETSLRNGLDGILNGGVNNKGSLYSGFFQFSIGLERLLKTTLVIDYMLRNAWQSPSNSWLKKNFGHDLRRLYDAVVALPDARNVKHPFPCATDVLDMRFLAFFSRFATTSRYYNLDSLTGTPSGLDPLDEWNDFLGEVFEVEVPASKKRKTKPPREFVRCMESIATVVQNGLDQQALGVQEAMEIPAIHMVTSPYIVRRLLRFLRPTREVLRALGYHAYDAPRLGEPRMRVPDMADLLLFIQTSDGDAVKKKRWR